MKELIKITESNGKRAVSARELYSYLTDNSGNVTRWMSVNIENNDFATEGVDYQRIMHHADNGRKQEDYAISIDFAKELSMMSQCERGKEARTYFIECEKKLVLGQFSLPRTFSEALQLAADQAKELESKKEEIALLDKLVDTLEPKAKVYNQISESETLLSLNDAAKVIGMGRNIMMEDLRCSGVFRANNTPYQKHIDSGLFEVKVKSVSMGFATRNYPQTFVTGKGLTWLSKRYPSPKK